MLDGVVEHYNAVSYYGLARNRIELVEDSVTIKLYKRNLKFYRNDFEHIQVMVHLVTSDNRALGKQWEMPGRTLHKNLSVLFVAKAAKVWQQFHPVMFAGLIVNAEQLQKNYCWNCFLRL